MASLKDRNPILNQLALSLPAVSMSNPSKGSPLATDAWLETQPRSRDSLHPVG